MSYTKKMTEGSELKHIILFTLPLFAGNVFQQLYNIVDSIIVGKYLGANKLAAVGTTGSLTYLFSTLCIGLSVGAGILISQRFGAGMHKEVRKLITNSAYVIIAFGAVITVISVAFAGLLMKMMNTPENLLEDATAYMRAACSGTICVAAYNWINSVMRSLGDSRTPLLTVVIACACNIAGDLLLCAGLGLGTAGAAIATVAAQVVSVSFLIILAIVNAMGVTASAGVGVAEKVCAFIMLISSAFVAQNYGAGCMDRARKALHYGAAVSFVIGVGMFFLTYFHGDLLAGIFSSDAEVIAAAADYLRSYAIDCLFTSIFFCYTGYYNGIGQTRFVMLQGIAGAFGVRVPVSYLISRTANATLFHIGLATPLSSIVQLFLCLGFMVYLKKNQTL